MFDIGDMVLMDSPEWPYLYKIGKVHSTYYNGDNKLTFVVVPIDDPKGRIGVSPDLCIDARPILREMKLKELGI